MNRDNYLSYVLGTVEKASQKTKKQLKELLLKKGIAYDENEQLEIGDKHDKIDISNYDLTNQVKRCLSSSDDAINAFEEWEFVKDYKYSVIFEANDFSKVQEYVVHSIEAEGIENDYLSVTEKTFKDPVKMICDGMTILKYSIGFSAIDPASAEEVLLKYPFIVVAHEEQKLVEFRFDGLPSLFRIGSQAQNFFSELIDNMLKVLDRNGCKLEPLDLSFMKNQNEKDDKVKLVAQSMKLTDGGNAELQVGDNQDYVMPFMGELKAILADHKEDFDKVPKIKERLEQFIYEKDELSDYPWFEIVWDNEIKTRRIHVKFIVQYNNKEYCLIQHYFSNVLIGMERMNYVTQYIGGHKGNS